MSSVKRMLTKNNGHYKSMCLSIASPCLVTSVMANIPGN